MERQYTKTHEWVITLPDGRLRVGLSDHAQQAMGGIVFAGLPEAGDSLTAGTAFGEVESVKAVSELLSPAGGVVDAVNEDAAEEPSQINSDPYGTWLIEIRDPDEMVELMDESAYEAFLVKEG